MSTKENKALIDFKQKLRDKFSRELVAVKLFGSRATGKVHSESDIDILVLFKNGGRQEEDILNEIICDILNSHGIYFEVVSYNIEEYEQDKRRQWPFVLNLEKEAVAV